MIPLTIDGKKFEAEEGKTLLSLAQGLGIEIPTLCYNPIVAPYSACRVCLVEVKKGEKTEIEPSCSTRAEEGMEILTQSPRALAARRVAVELLLARCPSVERIQEIAARMGIEKPRFRAREGKDGERCILCGLCVRMCGEVVGLSAINFMSRGMDREVNTPFHKPSETCIACGACAYVCPTGAIRMEDLRKREVIHDQLYLGPTTAIRVPFMQAIPNVPMIDRDACISFKTGQCKLCEKACEREAIDHEMTESCKEIEVGTVVLATGYDLFDCSQIYEYGYGRFDNVLTSLEFEHLCHASGPTGGNLLLEDGKPPESIAIIHCVGSRSEKYKNYCSRVCCMYALKFAHLVHEKTDARIYEFYIDMRSFGKGYEEFYNRMLKEGVNFIRGKAAEISTVALAHEEEGKLIIRCEDTLIGIVRRIPVDMVVLCPAMVPQRDAEQVAKLFGITLSSDGFFREQHPKLAPIATDADGVFVAGSCQGPKDIPDSVAQGAGAAGSVVALGETVIMEPITSVINDELCAGCKVCISVCPYDAITFNAEKKTSYVEEVICKGCGACVAACPSGAAHQNFYLDAQITAEIDGALLR